MSEIRPGEIRPGEILAIFEHDRGIAAETSYQSLGLARALLAAGVGSSITAVIIGAEADALAADLGAYGATKVVLVHHAELTDYAPEAWGEAIAELIAIRAPAAVVATGTDRGNEVLAYAAAIADNAFAANVSEIKHVGDASIDLTRVRWGGSLLEQSKLIASVYTLSGAAHTFSGDPSPDHVGTTAEIEMVEVTLPVDAARTRIIDRVTLASGITLTTITAARLRSRIDAVDHSLDGVLGRLRRIPRSVVVYSRDAVEKGNELH